MVSTHSNWIHDEFAPLVVPGSAEINVVRIMLCPKVMTQLMCGHQICLLNRHKQNYFLKAYTVWLHRIPEPVKKKSQQKDAGVLLLATFNSMTNCADTLKTAPIWNRTVNFIKEHARQIKHTGVKKQINILKPKKVYLCYLESRLGMYTFCITSQVKLIMPSN